MDNKVELMREDGLFLSAEGLMLFQHCYILLLVCLVWNVSVYTDLQWFSIICKNCVNMILEQLLATHQVVDDRGFKFWIKLCIEDDRVKSTQSYTEGIETPETVPSFFKIVFGCLLFDNITDNSVAWKIAEVVPIPKTNDYELANNNRPISLLPVL